MFGRVGYRIDRNVAICLAVVAAMLLAAGLALAVAAPSARAQAIPAGSVTRQAPHAVPGGHGVQSALCPKCTLHAVSAPKRG
jgi:cytochrome c5